MKFFLNTFALSLLINLCLGLSDSRLSQIAMKTDNIENLSELNKTAVIIGESDVNNTTEQFNQSSTTTVQTTSTTVLDSSTTGISSTESISTTPTAETSQSSTSTPTSSNTTANLTTTSPSLADVIPTRYAQAAQTNLSDLAQNISDTLTSAFGEHTDRLFTIDSETANETYASKYTPCQAYSNGLLCRLFYPYIKKLNQNVDQRTTTKKPSGLAGLFNYYNPNTGVFNNNYDSSNDYTSLLSSLFGQGYDNGYNNYPYNYAINNNNNNLNGISNNNNNLFGYSSGFNDNTNYYANYNRRNHHKYLNRFGADVY